MINQVEARVSTPYGVSHRSLLLLVSLWLPVKPAVIDLAVEFAALVNPIASVTLSVQISGQNGN